MEPVSGTLFRNELLRIASEQFGSGSFSLQAVLQAAGVEDSEETRAALVSVLYAWTQSEKMLGMDPKTGLSPLPLHVFLLGVTLGRSLECVRLLDGMMNGPG